MQQYLYKALIDPNAQISVGDALSAGATELAASFAFSLIDKAIHTTYTRAGEKENELLGAGDVIESVELIETEPSNDSSSPIERKPYATSRPSYAPGQIEAVWELALQRGGGKVYDPSGVEITWDRSRPRNGQWDMGHIPEEKYSVKHKEYMDGHITKEEFVAWYRDPNNYRPELPSTNRGHKYE